jgi:hypothetical protein
VIADRSGLAYATRSGDGHGTPNLVFEWYRCRCSRSHISRHGQTRRYYPLNLNGFLVIHRAIPVIHVKY